jgi:hypothetical protein
VEKNVITGIITRNKGHIIGHGGAVRQDARVAQDDGVQGHMGFDTGLTHTAAYGKQAY